MRVRQIIRNLLTNADRYGGEHVTVRIVENPETTSLFVIDDGKGVPADEQADIFEPYYRAGTRVESVGLGLTVSRDLARLMGGDLTYVYYQGHSFFELRLPTT
jgi:signal transduction histidine kinase